MKSIKVSIILPSLNVIDYMQECIESVLHQSLRDIEIICVDANSTDGTLEILSEYEKADNRVKVIISDKRSYGYQINIGIEAASGEYIGIVETDDYIPEEMYEQLYEVAKENCVDFVKADFYRFTGTGDKKALYRLSKNESYYNRVINLAEELECFYFPINTWSGIYSKKYLDQYHICHNETPGASYQDNGFWFQTFIYAKRAYFVKEPYYMNRRDNPNSSVFQKDKVFCIFDEYEFIWNILKENVKQLNAFKYIYAYCCYQAYKGHYERIDTKYKEKFLERCAKDFQKLQAYKALNSALFSDGEWKQLYLIMENPKEFYEQEQLQKIKICDEIRKFKNIIIYGVGMVGKKILQELMTRKIPSHIIAFSVTKTEENFDCYQGIPIRNIHELIEYRENALVVIATTQVHHEEIQTTLKNLGFVHTLLLPEI